MYVCICIGHNSNHTIYTYCLKKHTTDVQPTKLSSDDEVSGIKQQYPTIPSKWNFSI